MATAILHSVRSVTILFVESIDVPSVLGNLGHGRPALDEEFP